MGLAPPHRRLPPVEALQHDERPGTLVAQLAGCNRNVPSDSNRTQFIKVEFSLSGSCSNKLLKSADFLVDFSVDLFLLVFPKTMARKKSTKRNQTSKSTSHCREEVSLTI